MTARPRKPIVEKLDDLTAQGQDRCHEHGIGHVRASDVATLTDYIGRTGFVESMLDFAQPYFRPSFVSIMCIGDDGTPFLVGTESTVGKTRAALAAEGYARHFARDINYRLMQPGSAVGDFSTYQTCKDIADFPYRWDCYNRPGIADRRSVVRKRAGYALALNFYRSQETGEFSEHDRVILDGILGMLLSIVERHIAFGLKGGLAAKGDKEAKLAISYPTLTTRERQVLALALNGMNAREIAERLGIAETTVITHRKNAYRRIGVSNLREALRL